MGLPAELRNQILEEVLLTHDEIIEVTRTSHQQPGALRTCRQPCHEGVPIFLGCNFFAVEIYDLKLEPHTGHWVFQSIDKYQPEFYCRGNPSRSNFKQWLHMYFEGKAVPKVKEPDHAECTYDRLISQPFVIAKTLAQNDLSWSTAEEVIDAYMEGVEAASCSRDCVIWE